MAGRLSFEDNFASSHSAKKLSRESSLTATRQPGIPQKSALEPARRSVLSKKKTFSLTTAGNDFLRAELRDSAKRIIKEIVSSDKSASKYTGSEDHLHKRGLKSRPSSHSQKKEGISGLLDSHVASEIDKPLKWSKDDPRFKTCDSVSEVRHSEQTIKRLSSNGNAERLSFSQKSIINSIETMTRKSANFYFDRQAKQIAHESKDSVYDRLSNTHKFNSSNYHLQETQKLSRASMNRTLKHASSEKQSNPERSVRSILWVKDKHGVQTTDELKDMITQGMSTPFLPRQNRTLAQ